MNSSCTATSLGAHIAKSPAGTADEKYRLRRRGKRRILVWMIHDNLLRSPKSVSYFVKERLAFAHVFTNTPRGQVILFLVSAST